MKFDLSQFPIHLYNLKIRYEILFKIGFLFNTAGENSLITKKKKKKKKKKGFLFNISLINFIKS